MHYALRSERYASLRRSETQAADSSFSCISPDQILA